ncbi:uncharacterized protein LOC114579651 [Dendrobium catenatum]|uniref:uncharacterized protein LOC114579651 n=1 Tax=Dendrobium catenatum TaxID=906689 RepID=UPI0010A0008C|nr:uncharacterized protein LOC114579651 [Dendrobium catenatum]
MPKYCGGLGIPSIDSLYNAFGCSIIWRFYNINSYIFLWWKAKYVSFWNTGSKRAAVHWKFLCEVATKLSDSIQFRLTDSPSLSFFWEPWCFGSSVAERLKHEHLEHLIRPHNLTVSSLFSNGRWTLPLAISTHLVDIITSISISNSLNNCYWTNNAKPYFKTFHKCFFLDCQTVPWYKLVWHKHYALRFSIYTWMAFRHGLKTSDNLILRGLSVNPLCAFCQIIEESHNHLFFECDYSFDILKKVFARMNNILLRPNIWQAFHYIDEWDIDKSRKNMCYLLLCAIVYYIWRARNDRLFGNSIDCHSTLLPRSNVLCISKHLSRNAHIYYRISYFCSSAEENYLDDACATYRAFAVPEWSPLATRNCLFEGR